MMCGRLENGTQSAVTWRRANAPDGKAASALVSVVGYVRLWAAGCRAYVTGKEMTVAWDVRDTPGVEECHNK